jgi:riboflavin biosynthesis pyrimidine reductase
VVSPTEERFVVDRLWPEPAFEIDLDAAMASFAPPSPPPDRPVVGLNMITSIDGRAQRDGTAEGLGNRADRRLLQLYRASYDAVASGTGTLRQAGAWLRVGAGLAARRAADGRSPQPTGVVIGGSSAVDTGARWFRGDEPRILFVGANSPTEAASGTDVIRAPDERPEPGWVLARLVERGIRSVLLEGGPHLNAAFLAANLIDELYWTIGPILLATDALPMIATLDRTAGAPDAPRGATLVAALRHEDELFLRYRVLRDGSSSSQDSRR